MVDNTVMIEPFTESLQVQCSNWITDASSGALLYSLEGRYLNESRFRTLTPLSPSSNMLLTLPPGFFAVRPVVEDSSGAAAETQPIFFVNATSLSAVEITVNASVILRSAVAQFESTGNGAALLSTLSTVTLSIKDSSVDPTIQQENQLAVLNSMSALLQSSAVKRDGATTSYMLSLINDLLNPELTSVTPTVATVQRASTVAQEILAVLSTESVSSVEQITSINNQLFKLANTIAQSNTTSTEPGTDSVSKKSSVDMLLGQALVVSGSLSVCGQVLADTRRDRSEVTVYAASQPLYSLGSNSPSEISTSLDGFNANVSLAPSSFLGLCPTYVVKKMNATTFGYANQIEPTIQRPKTYLTDTFIYGWNMIDKTNGRPLSGAEQEIVFRMTSTFDLISAGNALSPDSQVDTVCAQYKYKDDSDPSTAELDTTSVTTVSYTQHPNGTVTVECKSNSTGEFVVAAQLANSSRTPGTSLGSTLPGGFSIIWLLGLTPLLIM